MSDQFNKYYNVRIKLRNDSWANWLNKEATFIPYDGEVIIYDILNENKAAELNVDPCPYQLIKIGDGKTILKNLPFINKNFDLAIKLETSESLGAFTFNDKDVFIGGLDLSGQQKYMCFTLQSDYYTVKEIDDYILSLRAKDNALETLLSEKVTYFENKINTLENEAYPQLKEEFLMADKLLQEQIDSLSGIDAELTKEINTNQIALNDLLNKVDNNIEHQESINFELKEAIKQNQSNGIVTIDFDSENSTYTIKQGGVAVGSVNIIKDSFVKDAYLKENNGTTYLELVLNSVEKPISINVEKLVNIYKHEENAPTVQLNVDENTGIISASIIPGSITENDIANGAITKDKLSTELKFIIENGTSSDGTISSETLAELRQYIDDKLNEASGVGEGDYGTNTQKQLEYDESFCIPNITVASNGRITSASDTYLQLPSKPKLFLNGGYVDIYSLFYAPEESGETGQIIVSNGPESAPSWSTIKTSMITQDEDDILILNCME